jgi:Fe(III) reductase, beta subunit
MSKLYLADPNSYDVKIGKIKRHFAHKVDVYPPGSCPLTLQLSFLRTSAGQTCGKCVPCRDGLPLVARLLQKVVDGAATQKTLDNIKMMATMIRDSSDCAIGWNAADEVLKGLDLFADEYQNHIKFHKCEESIAQKVPCISLCPAHIDIPGYIALIGEGDYAGAVNMVRRDNPFPTACGMVCEHPCEERCRRKMLESPINIRGLKKFAVDQMRADKVKTPKPNSSTGKKVAIIGGGPAGMTCAYFLALMGHKAVVYESHDKLGGMLRYGIPNYRFPKDRLDEDINAILGAGDVEVVYNTNVGKDIPIAKVQKEHDAMFVAIGAQVGKTLRMPGADAQNVFSAVEMLDDIGNGHMPDYTGKTVIVIGGGNVAMDAARSAVRCGAKEVSCVYRRRQKDMTALNTEIESAIMEGVVLVTLQSPVEITKHKDGTCSGLTTQPQKISTYRGGRPGVVDAAKPTQHFDADVILIAVGQDIVSAPFEEFGMKAEHNIFVAGLDTEVENMPGIYVGGDCATGPSTVIRAIAAGKVAAHNIDEYLGYHHKLHCEAVSPEPKENIRTLIGRTEIGERPAFERKKDFECVEEEMTYEEAMQECSRCLRCDHFGCGAMEGGTDI